MGLFQGAAKRHDGRNINDVAAALFLHEAGDLLGQHPDAADVDVEELIPLFQRKFQRGRAPGRSGVVYQNVDAAELLDGFPEHGVHRVFLGHVAGDRRRFHLVGRGKLGGRGFEILDLAGRQNNIRACLREARRDELADAPASARDQRDFPLKGKHVCQFHSVLLMRYVRPDCLRKFADRSGIVPQTPQEALLKCCSVFRPINKFEDKKHLCYGLSHDFRPIK